MEMTFIFIVIIILIIYFFNKQIKTDEQVIADQKKSMQEQKDQQAKAITDIQVQFKTQSDASTAEHTASQSKAISQAVDNTKMQDQQSRDKAILQVQAEFKVKSDNLAQIQIAAQAKAISDAVAQIQSQDQSMFQMQSNATAKAQLDVQTKAIEQAIKQTKSQDMAAQADAISKAIMQTQVQDKAIASAQLEIQTAAQAKAVLEAIANANVAAKAAAQAQASLQMATQAQAVASAVVAAQTAAQVSTQAQLATQAAAQDAVLAKSVAAATQAQAAIQIQAAAQSKMSVAGIVPSAPTWTIVYSNTTNPVDIGQVATDNLFSQTMILKRECIDCDVRSSVIYYRRLTSVAGFSIYKNIKYIWASANNKINTNFLMYGTLTDLQNNTNAFQYCDYDDFTGIGGFRDCGLTSLGGQWNSVMTADTRHVTYSVLNPASGPSPYAAITFPTPWKCVPIDNGNMTITRVRSIDSPECMSVDGGSCLWYKTTDMQSCQNKIVQLQNAPLKNFATKPASGLKDWGTITLNYFGF